VATAFGQFDLVDGFKNVVTSFDHSIGIWFGPSKPAAVPASNLIQTVSGRIFLVARRLYGTGGAFFDQTGSPTTSLR
jgi:hypothetical protein